MTDKRPGSRELQARVMGVMNVPMRIVLGLPFKTPLGKTLMLAYLTGRRSGRGYKVPLSYVRDDQVLLTPGGGRWKLNLVEGRAERLRIAGKDVMACPELVKDRDEVEQLLERMVANDSQVLKFARIGRDADGRLRSDQLELALEHGFCVVRWTPA
jgi:hypothetical protein